MVKIVIADDSPAVREGLRMRLALEADMQIVGEAWDGNEVLDIVPRLRPDIVIMDMEMPVMDGLTATKELLTLAPDSRVITLTIHDNATSRRNARDAGAAAFVSKLADDDALLHTIRAVNSSRVMKTGENSMFAIRFETAEDIPAIHQVNELAFGRVNEADLVDKLRRENAITLSLVAVQDEQVVGHVLITLVTIHNEDSQWDAVALGPMAVLPSHQKQGVGSALIRAAEFIGLRVLEQVPDRPCTHRSHHLVVLQDARQRDDFHIGEFLPQLLDGCDPIHDGHEQIYQDDVGMQFADPFDASPTTSRSGSRPRNMRNP
jgi:DNA-binding NarL/FixJ family response regulator